MKAILMSIRPQYVAKILNGEKTIEIRKRFPKDYVGWVYIYCTKEDNLMKLSNFHDNKFVSGKEYDITNFVYLNSGYEGKGKVVAKFTLNKVDLIRIRFNAYCGGELSQDGLCKYACLSLEELDKYLNAKNGYAWHIDNLVIFDKPKEISEFKPYYGYPTNHRLTRAPQSWCYIEI